LLNGQFRIAISGNFLRLAAEEHGAANREGPKSNKSKPDGKKTLHENLREKVQILAI
jgi:hypothetical protein